jgi:hypothetical protein
LQLRARGGISWDRSALRRLPREIPPDLSSLEVRDPQVMTQILRNTLFCKVYSYPFDLTTAYNYLIVLYLLALSMQAAATPLSDEMWRELGSLGVHGLPVCTDEVGRPVRSGRKLNATSCMTARAGLQQDRAAVGTGVLLVELRDHRPLCFLGS